MTAPHAPGDKPASSDPAPGAREPEDLLRAGGYRESAYALPRPPTRRRLGIAVLAALFSTASAVGVAALCRPPSVDARITAAERALRPRLAAIELPALSGVEPDALAPCPRITITPETIGLDNVAVLRAWPAADRARFLAALPVPWGQAAPLSYPALAQTSEVASGGTGARWPRLVPLRERLTDLLMFHPFGDSADARPCARRAIVVHADGRVPFVAVYAALAAAGQTGYASFLLAARIDGREAALDLLSPRSIALPPGRPPLERETLVSLARDGLEVTASVASTTAACTASELLRARFERTSAGYDYAALRAQLARLRRCDVLPVPPEDPPRPDESPADRAVRRAMRALELGLQAGPTTRLAVTPDVPWSVFMATFAAVRAHAPGEVDPASESVVLELVRPTEVSPPGVNFAPGASARAQGMK